jgi:hypothetical protein
MIRGKIFEGGKGGRGRERGREREEGKGSWRQAKTFRHSSVRAGRESERRGWEREKEREGGKD